MSPSRTSSYGEGRQRKRRVREKEWGQVEEMGTNVNGFRVQMEELFSFFLPSTLRANREENLYASQYLCTPWLRLWGLNKSSERSIQGREKGTERKEGKGTNELGETGRQGVLWRWQALRRDASSGRKVCLASYWWTIRVEDDLNHGILSHTAFGHHMHHNQYWCFTSLM